MFRRHRSAVYTVSGFPARPRAVHRIERKDPTTSTSYSFNRRSACCLPARTMRGRPGSAPPPCPSLIRTSAARATMQAVTSRWSGSPSSSRRQGRAPPSGPRQECRGACMRRALMGDVHSISLVRHRGSRCRPPGGVGPSAFFPVVDWGTRFKAGVDTRRPRTALTRQRRRATGRHGGVDAGTTPEPPQDADCTACTRTLRTLFKRSAKFSSSTTAL